MNELSKFIIGDTIANIKDASSRQFIGNLENLPTESKDSLVSAINEVDGDITQLNSDLSAKIGNLENLQTESKDSIVSSINELNGDITQLNSDLSDINAHLPIYGTTKGQGSIQDALSVDLTNVDGLINRVGYVYSDYTSALPSDCSRGIREVFYYNSENVFVKITGVDSNNKYAEWGNVYVNATWTGWVRL